MPESVYTLRDSPEAVRRIEADLEHVVAAVRAADPHLRSLVLTGGFARGEGAVLAGAPQNDYDFVALRGIGRSAVPYAALRRDLEAELGLHVDLAPVAAWRLPWVARTIFWYETALRGRTLWGEPLLDRIPVRSAAQLAPGEALRLLANRAAGLLLVLDGGDPHDHRIQASKGLLAALDAHLLALGVFPPSQRERWSSYEDLRGRGSVPAMASLEPWLEWAYRFKLEPADAAPREPGEAWRSAARAILASVPSALRRAGLPSLDAAARRDSIVGRAYYMLNAWKVRGARRFARHPTGRVRVGTLGLLETALAGPLRAEAAQRHFGALVAAQDEPLRVLAGLRAATLQ